MVKGATKLRQVRKKRSAMGGLKRREWRGETAEIWDVSIGY